MDKYKISIKGDAFAEDMIENNNIREIEVRFLEIDADKLKERLKEAGAVDLGGDFLKEVIFYDKEMRWQYAEKKFVRVRQTKQGVFAAFKHNEEDTATGTKEIELKVDNFQKAVLLLEEVGLVAFRHQEKKRHSFKIEDVIVDIDSWPSIPTYVELEGPSEEALRKAAMTLNLDWNNAVFESPRFVIEKHYGIPVSTFRYFTFHKIE